MTSACSGHCLALPCALLSGGQPALVWGARAFFPNVNEPSSCCAKDFPSTGMFLCCNQTVSSFLFSSSSKLFSSPLNHFWERVDQYFNV